MKRRSLLGLVAGLSWFPVSKLAAMISVAPVDRRMLSMSTIKRMDTLEVCVALKARGDRSVKEIDQRIILVHAEPGTDPAMWENNPLCPREIAKSTLDAFGPALSQKGEQWPLQGRSTNLRKLCEWWEVQEPVRVPWHRVPDGIVGEGYTAYVHREENGITGRLMLYKKGFRVNPPAEFPTLASPVVRRGGQSIHVDSQVWES